MANQMDFVALGTSFFFVTGGATFLVRDIGDAFGCQQLARAMFQRKGDVRLRG
jgi:hypothetical protein